MALEDLYTGIQEHRMVQFMYENQKGEINLRTVEPLEVKDGKLWGWDITKDQIRQFFLAMISECVLLDTVFVPRF